MTKKIDLRDLEVSWNFKNTFLLEKFFAAKDFSYAELEFDEYSKAITKIKEIIESNPSIAGVSKKPVWEKGWMENLREFNQTGKIEQLVPKYFGKYPVVRWKQNLILPNDILFEYNLLTFLIMTLASKYLLKDSTLYEFGCGTGHNLINLRRIFQTNLFIGLDWVSSSQRIVKQIAMNTHDENLKGNKFDYFKPNYNLKFKDEAVVLTVASLEQVGENFAPFLKFLMTKKPSVIINIEPMWETLDASNQLDSLSIKYMRKRKYLDGFYFELKKLQNEKKLRIHEEWRSFLGSFLLDGYSVVVWSPQKTYQ